MRTKHKIEFLFFISFVKLFHSIGLKRTRHTANLLAYLLYYFFPLRKKVIISNLKTAFPQKSDKEIKKLTLRNYQNILITFFELMILNALTKEKICSSIDIDNAELIKNKISDGKGAIILSGHFGGWEFCYSSLTLKIGKPLYLLAQPQSNPKVSDFVMKARETFGNKIILSGISVRRLYETIKNGGIVGIAGDQRGSYEGPRFNFFGRPTALHTGTAVIALKTGCPIIMTASERQKDYSYKMYMEELSFENLPNGYEEKIRELTQRYISFLEKHVRKNPEQYFWMHKIWKY